MKLMAAKRPCGRGPWAILLGGLLGSALVPPGAAGAEVGPAPGSGDSVEKIEEVIVTAQKRTERLQDVPISVQVIGGQALAERNQTSLEELTQTIPGVHISSGGFSNNLFIRGIGSGADNPSYDQSVATFVDDIYFGRSRTTDAIFLDLDRIEVLKGPQSTYFGNNAIAGALNIVTRKPGNTFDASGRVLYGQFGQYTTEAAAGGPISDTFGVRVAVTRNGVDRGWLDNVNLHEEVPHINNLAARVTFVYRPIEALDATLKVEGSKHRTAGSFLDQPLQYANCPPPAPIPPNFSGVCDQAIALGLPLGLQTNNTSGLPGQGNQLSTFQSVLTVDYRIGEGTLTAVSGFYSYHFLAHGDAGLTPTLTYQSLEPTEKEHQFSQELRFASATDQPLQYLAGVYFQTNDLAENIDINAPLVNPLTFIIPALAPLQPYLPLAFEPGFTQSEKVYSLFGSLSWNVTAALKLNVGLRASRDEKQFDGYLHYGTSSQIYGGFTPIPPNLEPLWGIIEGPPGTSSVSRSDHALMPSAGFQYQLAPEAMAYFSYNRGFKAGGFNGLLPNKALADLEFGAEHVNAYELGVKSKWLADRLLLNVAAFRSDYAGLQANTQVFQSATNSYTPLVRNAAASRSEGVELEAQWVATRELHLSANLTYLHSYYVSYPNATPTTLKNFCQRLSPAQYAATTGCHVYPFPVPDLEDLSGQPTAYSPRWSATLMASYSVQLPHDYRLTAELLPYLTTDYSGSAGATNDPLFHVGGYARFDARLSFESPSGRWALDVIGKNLTDRVIATNPGTPFFYFASKEMPRNVAAQVRVRW